MKELLLQYAQYNVWANKPIIDVLLNLGDGAVDKEVMSSFPSLRGTVYHIWSAESVWLQRLLLVEYPVWPESHFTGTFAESCREWEQVSEGIAAYTEKQDDKTLRDLLPFSDRQGNTHKMTVYQLLQHVCDHSTYHRGQLTSMLRQLGLTTIPQTDFILFVRQRYQRL